MSYELGPEVFYRNLPDPLQYGITNSSMNGRILPSNVLKWAATAATRVFRH